MPRRSYIFFVNSKAVSKLLKRYWLPKTCTWDTWSKPGVSNSICSVGHMRTYKAIRGPHYDADATTAVPELARKSYCIFISCKSYHEL